MTQLVDASATSTSKTVNYTYDDLYRMLTATATNVAAGQSTYTQTYAYDAIGNITSGPAGSYAYAGNQGSSYANPHAATTVGSDTLAYDNNGNLLTKGSSLSNTWDYSNRLTQAVAGAVTSTYAYDPSGTRVQSSDGTITTYYPTGAYNTDGTTPTKHISANGVNIATITGTGAGAAIVYLATDHLTGSNIATDDDGDIQETLDYFPYGGIRIDDGSFDEQRKYAGHEYDAATGLSYMGARYYDASIGRFLSEDPAFLAVGDANLLKSITNQDQATYLTGPQVFNSFAYARNNPLIYVDPNGSYPQWMNPIAFLPEKTQVAIGNWANNAAASNGAFDYATSHDSVGYALGGVTLAAGGAAAVLVGLGAAGVTAAGSACVAFCNKATEAGSAISQSSSALSGNATGFLGHSGFELKNFTETTRNTATEIGDRLYSGHALDQMQNRGIMPSVVENTIKNGVQFAGNNPVTSGFSDAVNRVQVITNNITNAVVTVIRGVKK